MVFSVLVIKNKTNTIVLDMRNFITNFRKTLGICKQFAGNQVNEKGNVARCGVIHSYDMTADNVKTWKLVADKGYISNLF